MKIVMTLIVALGLASVVAMEQEIQLHEPVNPSASDASAQMQQPRTVIGHEEALYRELRKTITSVLTGLAVGTLTGLTTAAIIHKILPGTPQHNRPHHGEAEFGKVVAITFSGLATGTIA